MFTGLAVLFAIFAIGVPDTPDLWGFVTIFALMAAATIFVPDLF